MYGICIPTFAGTKSPSYVGKYTSTMEHMGLLATHSRPGTGKKAGPQGFSVAFWMGETTLEHHYRFKRGISNTF